MNWERRFMMLLATLVLLMNVFFAHLILTADNMDKNKTEIAHLVLGYLFGLSNIVVGYYFLSSKSSREKTDMLRDIILPTDVYKISEMRELIKDKDFTREQEKPRATRGASKDKDQ